MRSRLAAVLLTLPLLLSACTAAASATSTVSARRMLSDSPEKGWICRTVMRGDSSPARRSSSTVSSPQPPARAAESSSFETRSSKQLATNCPEASLIVASR